MAVATPVLHSSHVSSFSEAAIREYILARYESSDVLRQPQLVRKDGIHSRQRAIPTGCWHEL